MKKATAVAGLMILLLVAGLFGCARKTAAVKTIQSVTDLSRCAGMTNDTDRIEVQFDNYSGEPFLFTIEDPEQIRQIMELLFSASLEDWGTDGAFAGCNTSITVVQGENSYTLNVQINREGDHYYAFSTGELSDKITELARAAGAYEGVG